MFSVPNTVRNQKLTTLVAEIVEVVKSGDVAVLTNGGEFTNSVVEVAEKAKRALTADSIVVHQTNELSQKEVLNEVDPANPLEKPKIHHYVVKLKIKLSSQPFAKLAEGETYQPPYLSKKSR